MKYTKALAAVLAAMLHTTVHSAPSECEQQPPLRDSGHYFEFDYPQPFEASEIRQIELFSKALRGKWRGGGTIVDCIERQRTDAGYRRDFKFAGETIEYTDGALKLEGEREIKRTDTVSLERILLTPAIYRQPHSQRWHTLQFKGDNTMIYSEKFRRRTAYGLSQFVHVIRKLELKGDVLHVDSLQFINGAFAEQTGTRLVRSS